jgi:hypothetical protein
MVLCRLKLKRYIIYISIRYILDLDTPSRDLATLFKGDIMTFDF